MEKPEDPCLRLGAVVEPSCRVRCKTTAVKYEYAAPYAPVPLQTYVWIQDRPRSTCLVQRNARQCGALASISKTFKIRICAEHFGLSVQHGMDDPVR
jgi:hypothetical protein